MNGYIESGYIVVLGSLAAYGATLIRRERNARARLGGAPEPAPPTDAQEEPESVSDEEVS